MHIHVLQSLTVVSTIGYSYFTLSIVDSYDNSIAKYPPSVMQSPQLWHDLVDSLQSKRHSPTVDTFSHLVCVLDAYTDPTPTHPNNMPHVNHC